MKIAIGGDRRGLEYKTKIVDYLIENGHEIIDVGTHENIPCDSPVFAANVGKLVSSGECKYGILICATGTGIAIAENKVKALCVVLAMMTK